MSYTEDDVMKMRLLVDGDGTGDDRKLNILLKTMIRWCNSDDDQQSCEVTYQRMLTQLAGIEWNMTKSQLAADMNKQETDNYSKLHKKVEEGILSAQKEIDETKAELTEAKRIRKNRMEYDALAKVITTHPDRETSQNRIEQLQTEQKLLEEREVKLEEKLDIRKKQFHVLVSSIHQLQDLLAADDELSQKTGTTLQMFSGLYIILFQKMYPRTVPSVMIQTLIMSNRKILSIAAFYEPLINDYISKHPV